MSQPEITPEKRRLIADLAEDIIRELEQADGVMGTEYDLETLGEYYTGKFSSDATNILERFLVRQIGKGLL